MAELYPPPIDYFDLENPVLKTEFVFQVRIDFKERRRFEPTTPMGGRVYVPCTGGEITGPRLQGRVIPMSGADFARGRADRVGELNAHYMFEASDGTPIYIYNRGYIYPYDRTRPQTFEITPHYFRVTPVFDTPVGPHDWLTRTVIVGIARRFPNPDHSIFQYFAVL